MILKTKIRMFFGQLLFGCTLTSALVLGESSLVQADDLVEAGLEFGKKANKKVGEFAVVRQPGNTMSIERGQQKREQKKPQNDPQAQDVSTAEPIDSAGFAGSVATTTYEVEMMPTEPLVSPLVDAHAGLSVSTAKQGKRISAMDFDVEAKGSVLAEATDEEYDFFLSLLFFKKHLFLISWNLIVLLVGARLMSVGRMRLFPCPFSFLSWQCLVSPS